MISLGSRVPSLHHTLKGHPVQCLDCIHGLKPFTLRVMSLLPTLPSILLTIVSQSRVVLEKALIGSLAHITCITISAACRVNERGRGPRSHPSCVCYDVGWREEPSDLLAGPQGDRRSKADPEQSEVVRQLVRPLLPGLRRLTSVAVQEDEERRGTGRALAPALFMLRDVSAC